MPQKIAMAKRTGNKLSSRGGQVRPSNPNKERKDKMIIPASTTSFKSPQVARAKSKRHKVKNSRQLQEGQEGAKPREQLGSTELSGLDRLLEERIQGIMDAAKKAPPGFKRWLAAELFITENDSPNVARAVLDHAVEVVMRVPTTMGWGKEEWLKQVSHDFQEGKTKNRSMLYHMRDAVAKWDLARGQELVEATNAVEALIRFCGYPDIDEVGLCFSIALEKRMDTAQANVRNSSESKIAGPVFKAELDYPKSFSPSGWLEEYIAKRGVGEDREDVEDSYSCHKDEVAELKGVSEAALNLAFSQDYGIDLVQRAIGKAMEEFKGCEDDRIIAIALEAIRIQTPAPSLREIATLELPTFIEQIRLLDACIASGYWQGESTPSKAEVMANFEVWRKCD